MGWPLPLRKGPMLDLNPAHLRHGAMVGSDRILVVGPDLVYPDSITQTAGSGFKRPRDF